MLVKKNVEVFNKDVLQGNGYEYTDENRYSARIANERMTQAIKSAAQWSGKRVLDIGCGDGAYTGTLLDMGAASVLGVDPAITAIERARIRAGDNPRLNFVAESVYDLGSRLAEKFDVVVLRGVLHHLPDAASAVRVAASLANEIVILEPNGLNPVLKLIERFSSYHTEHEEQSFLPSTLRKWCLAAGATPTFCKAINFVPFFCPTPLARLLKTLEPVVENIPGLRNIACGQIIIRAEVR